MNILYLSSDRIPHIGGKSTHILDLINGLESNGITCHLISLASIGKIQTVFLKLILIPLRVINRELYFYFFKEVWGRKLNSLVYNYCKHNKIDFISVQDAWAAYSIKRSVPKLKVPVILTMHTYLGIENLLDRKTSKIGQFVYIKTLNKEKSALEVVDKIVAVDNRIKKHIENVIAKHSAANVRCITVVSIMNFTNIEKFRIPTKIEKQRFRKEFKASDSQFLVRCARRLVEKNGVINLVKLIVIDTG